jgi:hypothetical protein
VWWSGGTAGSTVDRAGDTDKRATAPRWRVSARARRCSLALAGEDEKDEVKPEAGSPEHERRRKGGAMAAEDSRHAGARARGRARERGEDVRWWPGVLEGLYRGPQERLGWVTTGS